MNFFKKKKNSASDDDGKKKTTQKELTVKKIDELYTVGAELGTGGFATVKLGIPKNGDQDVAIKMIRNNIYKKNKEATDSEVSIMRALEHQSIVKIDNVVRTDKYFCIVMELCRGGELFERIVEKEKYTEDDAKNVAKEMLEGLLYVHDQNVVHRDLKPENIIFADKAETAPLKITDFGFATYVPKDGCTQACGTPEYVAPEVLAEEPYGTAVDMWSMGVIIYILLCGFPPFYGDSDEELFSKIEKANFTFIMPYWGPISELAKNLISQLLIVDPTKRLSAQQALDHKWFADSTKGAELGGAVTSLKKFNATRKLRKAVLMMVAAHNIEQAFKAKR